MRLVKSQLTSTKLSSHRREQRNGTSRQTTNRSVAEQRRRRPRVKRSRSRKEGTSRRRKRQVKEEMKRRSTLKWTKRREQKKPKIGHVLLEKGVGSEMKEDGVRRRTGLHTSIHGPGPAPIGFSSPFLLHLLLPARAPSPGQANLSFRPSCFNVLTRVALPPPLAIHHLLLLRYLRLRVHHAFESSRVGPDVPFTVQQNEPPKRQLIFQEATSALLANSATPTRPGRRR